MMIIIIVEGRRHLSHLVYLWQILLQRGNINEKLNGLFIIMPRTKEHRRKTFSERS